MSTKTIALEASVYARLASRKRESESFTMVIDRLLSATAHAHTGQSVLAALGQFHALPEGEVETMRAVVAENRAAEEWSRHDLP